MLVGRGVPLDLSRQLQTVVLGAVAFVMDGGPGSGLAMNVLRQLVSERAARLAFAIYRQATGDRASNAAWLLKHTAHPCSLECAPVLLADDANAFWGIDLLDPLAWRDRVEPEALEPLVRIADNHARSDVRDKAAFVCSMLVGNAAKRPAG